MTHAEAMALDSTPERSAVSLINPDFLPYLRRIYLSGNFWTPERCTLASRSIAKYNSSNKHYLDSGVSHDKNIPASIHLTFFHLGGNSLSLRSYPPLDMLKYIHTGIFRIQPFEIDIIVKVIPLMINIRVLEIATTPNFSVTNSSFISPHLNIPFLRALHTLKFMKRLVLNDSSPNSIALPALDGSWIPPSMTEIECFAGHFINIGPSMPRHIYNHITHVNFGFGAQSHSFISFPFSHLTYLELNDDWTRTGYKAELIQEALHLNRHTLKTIICFSLDNHELFYLAKYCYMLEVVKVFKVREAWNMRRYPMGDLFNEFIKYNGVKPEDKSGKHRTRGGRLRVVTLPTQSKSISYTALERFVMHFKALNLLVFYMYYPIMPSYSDARMIKANMVDKIQDLIEPPVVSSETANSSYSGNVVDVLTKNQVLLARYLFTMACCYCSGTYPDSNKFDVQALHFYFKLEVIREYAFIREYEGLDPGVYQKWHDQFNTQPSYYHYPQQQHASNSGSNSSSASAYYSPFITSNKFLETQASSHEPVNNSSNQLQEEIRYQQRLQQKYLQQQQQQRQRQRQEYQCQHYSKISIAKISRGKTSSTAASSENSISGTSPSTRHEHHHQSTNPTLSPLFPTYSASASPSASSTSSGSPTGRKSKSRKLKKSA